MTKYIFVLGGVSSSLGKGVASAAIGCLLKSRGYSVRVRKLDPYLNVYPGKLSPLEHGEVFVTTDGGETDLDLGHYERFADIDCMQTDTISGGKIYKRVLEKEASGAYYGRTVQAIPHVTNEIKDFISADLNGEDFVVCEVGGTVGDMECTLFYEAVRQFRNDVGHKNACVVFLTLLPYIESAGELKTKPTQHAVKSLLEVGIQADILLCRSKYALDENERKKIALFCNVAKENVMMALDVDSLYKIPLAYHEQGLDVRILGYFDMLEKSKKPDLKKWEKILDVIANYKKTVEIAVVGKYCALQDAYKSIGEALAHAGIANEVKVKVDWIDAAGLEAPMNDRELDAKLKKYAAILVPDGSGEHGVDGKIRVIKYAREQGIPFFGICLGMQMAVVEMMRHLADIKDADSSEFKKACTPVVYKKSETARLGSFPIVLKKESLIGKIYGKTEIEERHQNRYEVDVLYMSKLEEKGVLMSACSPDGSLPEAVEIPAHPFFLGVQFHPEFKSRPGKPHPIFDAFIKAAVKKSVKK